jgi:AraC-like DNA-binding protein
LLGFSSLSSFSRWFVAEFGTTAVAYQRGQRVEVR